MKLLQKQIGIKSFEAHCHNRLHKSVNVSQTTSTIIIRVLLRLDTQAVRNKQQYHANAYRRTRTTRDSECSQQTATPSLAFLRVFFLCVSDFIMGCPARLNVKPSCPLKLFRCKCISIAFFTRPSIQLMALLNLYGLSKYITRRYQVHVLP